MEKDDKKVEKEKPNFGLSGKLTEETNTYKGVVIKYSEPPEARKPQKIRWRLYPFKGQESLQVMYIHRQSAYLLGRERKVVDIPIDHPSCSKQHAVIQYRLMPYERPDGSKGRRIRPYIIDLNSANGTFVNGSQIQASRYVELLEKDILKFGFSSREYVILHDESKEIEDESDEEGSTSKANLPPPIAPPPRLMIKPEASRRSRSPSPPKIKTEKHSRRSPSPKRAKTGRSSSSRKSPSPKRVRVKEEPISPRSRRRRSDDYSHSHSSSSRNRSDRRDDHGRSRYEYDTSKVKKEKV